ncbi:glycosyltransferase family 4 protein [Pseudomonas sp. ABC1]|uniref:glycosyltransferase n=1 Tax=Pseudomonas sp. ABC1 TaxID=2748080 RepID=UPI0015C39D68|nr:glycosyltransferase [Pseudomonas sp. ABC1]QLF94494.1 glycosyltransferase family 4 protein [Pseudomonas sp. ABC1]
MSKLLFVHDHTFTLVGDDVYSSGAFPSWAWNRYLTDFSSVTVAARSKKYSGDVSALRIDRSEREGVEFRFLENISTLQDLVTGGGDAGRELRELVASHDAVVVRLSSELGLLALRHAVALNKKVAVELVDCPWDSYWNYGGLAAKLYAPLITRRVRSAVKQADGVLYVTQAFLQNRYPCRRGALTTACSNVNLKGIDESTLTGRLERILSREQIVKDSPVIGQIASLTGRFKGIQVMLEVIPELIKTYPGLKYKVLGAGDPKPFLLRAEALGISDHVEFCGTVPSGEPVLNWLDNIDLYVHPSLKEGLPRGVIEAMSRGCPVVATSVAGTPELLSNKFLVKPKSKKELLEKVLFVLSDSCDLAQAARDNFTKSKEYSSPLLENRRSEFWAAFAGRVYENNVLC